MNEFALDASALIAMLRAEPGAQKVSNAIPSARMSVVNYAEVVSYFIHAGMNEREIYGLLDPLPIELIVPDKGQAQLVGRLRATTSAAGLSLGDRFCLALALREGIPAWTADKGWIKIADAVGVTVIAIR